MAFPGEGSEAAHHRSSLLSDFYIDFLGSLLPGLFAVVLTVAVLAVSLTLICRVVGLCASAKAATVWTSQESPLSNPIIELKGIGFGPYGNIGLVLVAAYILGSIFFRQDPKEPDLRSARRVWRNTNPEDRLWLAVRPLGGGTGSHSALNADFPYYYLREYLDHRGLTHLAQWVPWSGSDPSTHRLRTKMFVNILKIRLQFLVPERCKEIVRNEAHVRMTTSVWYAAGWVMWCALSAFGAVALGVIAAESRGVRITLHPTVLGVVILDLLVAVGTLAIKWRIEHFLHYQRVREIVYVLETAHFAHRNGFDLHPWGFCTKAEPRMPIAGAASAEADPHPGGDGDTRQPVPLPASSDGA